MKNKFYILFFSVLFSGLASARAQDTAGCNAGFTPIVAGNQVYFWAADSARGVPHQWNFGDSTQASTGSGLIVHHYSRSGPFTVTLTVTDSLKHCQSSSSQLVYIPGSSTPTCNVGIVVSGDNATHLYSFVAQLLSSPGTIDTVSWTVNGMPAGRGDTLNRHLSGGTYTVCATVSTSLGCQSQACTTVNVGDSLQSNPPPPDSALPSTPDTTLPILPAPPDSVKPSAPDSVLPGHFISAYPNPATTQANLAVKLDQAAMIAIRVYNSMGSEILSTSQSGYPGVNTIVIAVASLPTGIYYVQLLYANTLLKSKIQKL